MKKKTVFGRLSPKDLGMQKVSIKLSPRLLNDVLEERREQVYLDIIERLQSESDLLCRVIIGYETWIFEYDSETKYQSCQ